MSSAEKRFAIALRVLIVMIVGLMALGAGVRTMNAGLACPDWPLCFGKVIPDFHVGVYFEFIHRAYAGTVSLLFFAICIYAFLSRWVSRSAKWFAGAAVFVLLLQILMGGLTVLKLLRVGIVTSHLMLATTFYVCVLWISFLSVPGIEKSRVALPRYLRYFTGILPVAVFGQMFLGGLVASSYAGLVCVDFPTCNGQWIPTLEGPIGLQVMHRFGAYLVAFLILSVGTFMHLRRHEPWMTGQLKRLIILMQVLVLTQICIGVANLKFFIPPSVTVLHQSVAVILLGLSFRLYHVVRSLATSPVAVAAAQSLAIATI